MADETEKNPQQQKPQPGGSVNAPDTKTWPLTGQAESEQSSRRFTKKIPIAKDGDPQHEGQRETRR